MRSSDIEGGNPSRRGVLGFGCAAVGAWMAGGVAAQTIPKGLKLPPLPAAWGRAEILRLWPGRAPGEGFRAQPLPAGFPDILLRNVHSPELHVFPPPKAVRSNGRSLLVIPGGAYSWVSILNEGFDVAARFGALGYTTFVLVYRLPAEGWHRGYDVPLADAQRAVRLLRDQAEKRGLDREAIVALGFSAGGHLAASLATGHAEKLFEPVDAIDRLDARPSAAGLVYPVISLSEGIGHADSTRNLVGSSPASDVVARRSPAMRVGRETPPLFLAHAMDDAAVSFENSVLMMKAMQAAKRPMEAHYFESGGHAFGVGRSGQPNLAWPELFDRWLGQHLENKTK